MLLKQRFGISLQAHLYRLRDLNIISHSYYERWCRDISRLGWRKQEPLELLPEQPQWLRQSVLRAFAEGLISQEEAKEMLGEAIEAEQPLSLIERRAFLKLSMEERRRILRAHAEKIAPHYERSTERKELQGGDLVEY
jgi:hypothetical protein